jgi:hypothetical protein
LKIFLLNHSTAHQFKEESMKRHHKKNFLLMLLLAATLVSCGSDDDDSDDTPQTETDTTGSNGTTGSSGTSGTTGGTSSSCMSKSQQERISLYMNRASDLRTFTGVGTESTRDSSGSLNTNPITGVIDYQQSGENTWIINSEICTASAPVACHTRQTVVGFKNGCLNVNGAKARIVSVSDSSITYSYFDARTVREQASVSTGKLNYNINETKSGVTTYKLNFKEQ